MTGPGAPHGPAARLMIARALDVDRVTSEVVRAFAAAGVRSVLLKGPALAAWLYDDGVPRTYVDSDLLVAPEKLQLAGSVLARLGFEEQPADAPHARTWLRRRDGGQVDLHAVIAGMALVPADAWRIVSASTETMTVGGTPAEVPRITLRALIVALHAVHHRDAPQPLEDLSRAVARAPEESWREAAAIAARIGAIGPFSVGLRLVPAGDRLADRLRLPSTELVERATAQGSRAQIALGLDRLAERRGIREKLALLLAEAVPTREFMRWWSPLARRGPAGLALAYPVRIGWLLWHTPLSLLAWRRSRAVTPGSARERT